MSETDWSNLDEMLKVSPEEIARLEAPSGKRCPCGRDTTVGEDENFGVCYRCFDWRSL